MADALWIALITLGITFSGMPLVFAFGISGLACAALFGAQGAVGMLPNILYESVNSFELLTIPLFVFMGVVIAVAPSGKDLYEAINRFMGRLPGGIAVSSVVASSIFAAMCGSSAATAAAIGTSGIPEMRKRGIPDGLATGCIVGGGTLGILIPPSITFIVYGTATETSIGQLFIAGIVPGILVTLAFCCWAVFSVVLSRRKGAAAKTSIPARTRYSWAEKREYLPKALPFLALIGAIMYSIYYGVATPSEAAAIGAFGALLITAVSYGSHLTGETLKRIMGVTVNETAMLMLIATTTVFYGNVLTEIGVTQQLADVAATAQGAKWVAMGLINVVLLVMGCFLPPFAIILLTAPLLLPLIRNLGFDPIWFGVIMTLNMEIGCITPPFGINLFVVKGVAPDVPMPQIIRGALPFVAILVLSIVSLCAFPQIALWLPSRMAPM